MLAVAGDRNAMGGFMKNSGAKECAGERLGL